MNVMRVAGRQLLPGLMVLACVVHVATAQSDSTRVRTRAGIIDGIVSDTTLVPLEGAMISVLGSELRVTTHDNGRFRMLGVPLGDYVLLVRRLGYEGATTKISVEPEAATRVAFALKPVVTRLAGIEVTERGVSQRMTAFYERRDAGVGYFFTHEDIATRSPVSTFEMFRGIPSLKVGDMGTDGTARIVSARSGCAPQIMLNGLPITAASVPAPTEVGGIEVYSGPATIPLQFKGKGAWCALILIWTGDGR